jgi:hypothetical protein
MDCTGGGCEGNVDGGNPYTGGIAGVTTPPSSGTATAPGSRGGGHAVHGFGGHGPSTWQRGQVPPQDGPAGPASRRVLPS